jgi:RNA polymerase sigma-70 factor, ECF subfamily
VRTPAPLGEDRRAMNPIYELQHASRRAPFGLMKPTLLSDEDLLELVAERRDERAFDELYRRYARAVYGVCRRLIGDHGRSEDVVQEAFTKAWRAAAGYRRDRGTAAGWLFTIARNAALDALRSRVSLSHSEGPDLPDDSPGPDVRAEAAEEAFHVHALVDGLPDHERAVIELAYFEGLSQTEVATRLGMPLGTIKSRTRRALTRLANRLADERERDERPAGPVTGGAECACCCC